MSGRPDPKPAKRIRDSKAVRSKLVQEPHCRACGAAATDGHHILLRSQGGDDVPDNVMPLCSGCHRGYHDGRLRELRIRAQEEWYVKSKMGREQGLDYLRRRYRWGS